MKPLLPDHSYSLQNLSPTEMWIWRFVVVLLFGFALYYGLYLQLDRGVWFDEVLTTFFISLEWGQLFELMAQYEANMALYYIALKAWSYVSTTELWLRLFSLFAYLLTAAVLFLSTRPYFGKRSSYLFLGLFFSHFLLIRYGVEIRGYAIASLFIALIWATWLRVIFDNEIKWWAIYSILGIFAVHTHLFVALGILFSGTILLIMIRDRKTAAFWVGSHALIVASFLPLLIFTLTRESGQLDWVANPTIRTLTYGLFELLGVSNQADLKIRYSLPVALVASAIIFIATSLCTVFSKRTSKTYNLDFSDMPVTVFIVISGVGLFLFVVTIAFLVSFIKPIFSVRFFIPYVPILLVVLAYSLTQTAGTINRYAVLLAPALLSLSTIAYSERENTGWKSAYAEIAERCNHVDSVFYFTPRAHAAIKFYQDQLDESCKAETFPYELTYFNYFENYNLEPLVELYDEQHENVLFVLAHTNYTILDIEKELRSIRKSDSLCTGLMVRRSISIFECKID